MNRLTRAAAITGFLTVAFGAFGAHGLEARLSAEAQGWWETATFYALTHAVAALALSLSGNGSFARGGWAFIIGAVLFAGSLYGLALMSLGGGAPGWVGAITPVGGLAFLGGWALIALAARKRRD